MKLLNVIAKNFKILFRKKLTFLTIFFGPLLVIILMSITFSSTSNIQISVGYIAPDDSILTRDFVASLDEKYLAKQFAEKEPCIKELEQGLIHACIVFPKQFEIENNKTNIITFVVDQSRISLVYTVIDEISENIEIQTDELSKGLTEKLTSTLTQTNKDLDSSLVVLITAKGKLNTEKTNIDGLNTKLGEIKSNSDALGIGTMNSDISELHNYTQKIYDGINLKLTSCLEDIASLDSMSVSSNRTAYDDLLDDLTSDLNAMKSLASVNVNDSSDKITSMQTMISTATAKITAINTLTAEQSTKLIELKTKLDGVITDLDLIKTNIEHIQNNINNIEITSSDKIVNPITTTIETISTDDNKLSLIFPYVLILLVMFSSLLLSSTLVVVEKQSNAAFRTFTTPTKDEFFILTTFITSFIIIAAQLVLILAATSYFLFDFILANIYVNLVLLSLTISLFVMIGMSIGYLLKTQQATNMATISIGTLFLFVSNIVFPLESISPQLKMIAKYNPFVLTSELIRKSILFNIEFSKIQMDLIILCAYSILFLILIIIFQKMSKINYFKKNVSKGKVNKYMREFILMNNKEIRTRVDLIEELKNTTDENFNNYRKENLKDFKLFLTMNLEEEHLGNLKNISRIKLIEGLEKNIIETQKRIFQNGENTKILFKEDDEEDEELDNKKKRKKKSDDDEEELDD